LHRSSIALAMGSVSKMDICDREEYLNWLADYEFNLFKIPQPDCVIFLDVPIEFSKKLTELE
ncbi:hypothetical protein, partial [Klebsiella aerogenes]